MIEFLTVSLLQDTSPTVLKTLLDWALNASTQIAVLTFLGVGVISTIWVLAVKPALVSFSPAFRRYVADREYSRIRPLLQEMGFINEGERVRDVGRLRLFRQRNVDGTLSGRLKAILSESTLYGSVKLGKQYSEPLPYFVDLRSAAMVTHKRDVLADILANLIATEIDKRIKTHERYHAITRVICMKEGNPLVGVLAADKLRIPVALYRGPHFPRFHGSAEEEDYFDGEIEPGDNVIIVDDTAFRGTTLIQASRALVALSANVTACFLLFEAHVQFARDNLQEMGIPLHSVMVIDAESGQ